MLVEGGEAVTGQGRAGIAQHAADIDARRLSADEQARIDRRVEQRKLASDTGKVLTMPQLEQPTGHRGPVAEQLLVGRNFEVEGLRRGRGRTHAVAATTTATAA